MVPWNTHNNSVHRNEFNRGSVLAHARPNQSKRASVFLSFSFVDSLPHKISRNPGTILTSRDRLKPDPTHSYL